MAPVEELAYAAGFIDGEGTIRVERCFGARGTRRFRAYIEASQVKPGPLLFLQERWGGHLYTRQPVAKRARPVFRWQLADYKAIQFATEIRPYLVVKAEQADLLIALGKVKRRNASGKPYSAEELAIQAELYLQSMDLNRRGI